LIFARYGVNGYDAAGSNTHSWEAWVMAQQLTALIYPLILFFVLGVVAPLLLANAADASRK